MIFKQWLNTFLALNCVIYFQHQFSKPYFIPVLLTEKNLNYFFKLGVNETPGRYRISVA